jgi:hypothetical protein
MPALSLIFILSLLLSIFYELPFSEDYLLHLISRDFLSFFFITIAVCRKGVLDFIG